MLLQREIQHFSDENGTTRFCASWPMSARPPNAMPERAHHCSTIAISSPPNSGSLGSTSLTRPSRKRRDLSDSRTGRDMEHRAVDPVELLADILDQQIDAGEVGLERGPEQVRQHGQVERHGRPVERGFERRRIASHQPVQRAVDRRLAAVTQGVLRHRPPCCLQPGLVEARRAGIRHRYNQCRAWSAPPPANRPARLRQCGWSHSRRARTRPRRSPDRPSLPQGREPRFVGTGEMAFDKKHCGWMTSSQSPRSVDDRLNRLGGLALQGAARSDDGDAHWRRLWKEREAVRNGPTSMPAAYG